MKPTLLLLHGALGAASQMAPLITLLESHYEVFTLNFEGHGGRLSSQEFSIQLFASNVADFLKEKEVGRLNVFGYSMGGYVALHLALQHPGLFNSLVTLGTKFDWTPESAAKELRMLDPDKIEAKVPAFSQRLHALHAPDDWKEIVRKTGRMMERMGAGERIEHASFPNLRIPVTIGLGEQDRMVSVEESTTVADLLPNGSFVSLPDVVHPIDQVSPETLAYFLHQSIPSL